VQGNNLSAFGRAVGHSSDMNNNSNNNHSNSSSINNSNHNLLTKTEMNIPIASKTTLSSSVEWSVSRAGPGVVSDDLRAIDTELVRMENMLQYILSNGEQSVSVEDKHLSRKRWTAVRDSEEMQAWCCSFVYFLWTNDLILAGRENTLQNQHLLHLK
jgi:hypothetical protein